MVGEGFLKEVTPTGRKGAAHKRRWEGNEHKGPGEPSVAGAE